MVEAAKEAMKKGEKSVLSDYVSGNPEELTFRNVVQAARERDPLTMKVVEEAGRTLGKKIAFLVNLLNPEIVIIGGGIEDCGAVLLDAVKASVKEWSVEESANQVKIIPSAFGENAVALGVVGIVAREVFAQA